MYRTTKIAKRVNVHPNTVRIYEEWGYISPVPRTENGYRIFSDIHLFQLLVARTAFRCEIVQGHIRAKARAIVEASGKENFSLALELAQDYLNHLEQEYARALEAIELVEKWLSGTESWSDQTYTRKEAAKILDISSEVVRNWERNHLMTVPRLDNGHRIYTEKEINRMKIIRTLRAAHYSTSAILRLLNQTEKSKELNVKSVLNTPGEYEEIITLSDRLIHSLEEAIQNAQEVIQLLIKYEK
ncbi:MerR family transcriptional regulator [Paenibacillus sp. N3/727]|uniref:MerR family transcriptional regulator n=1 Tax=Paenibacillus sp. N3/727 TaxID=2925845 RepID=UPI001F52C1D9|nr:MerR family transcriptional regulator [Paenibacillus sp. N3/727]UNK18835.1 MerR family transcriptional regulator [Paenibacillus sp. N3/727]